MMMPARREKKWRRAAAPAIALLAAAVLAAAGPAAAQSRGPEALGFTKHFAVEIVNPSPLTLENHVVIIDVPDIRAAVAADFNSYMYALFDPAGGEYALVVSQADDLDKDRAHDQIVLVRSLPPSSTTRLLCYYTPARSFQLMPAQKAFARGAWRAGGAEAGWESNLAAYRLDKGRIGIYGKLQPGLILKKFPAAEAKIQDWGLDLVPPEASAGFGGLSIYDGTTRNPLFGTAAPQAKVTVLALGPVRALVKAEYPAVKTSSGEIGLTVYYSAYADNIYSRQDVVVTAKPPATAVLGICVPFLPSQLSTGLTYWSVWGEWIKKAGDIGLAVIFRRDDEVGVDQRPNEFHIKLNARSGRPLTYWIVGVWDRGLSAPADPSLLQRNRMVDDLAARLYVPVKVELKAK